MALFRRRRKAAGGVTFYGPEDTIDSKFNISGESYRRDEITALVRSGRRLVHRDEGWERLGAQFWLVPDPENPYDKTAVAVFAGSRDGFDADTAVSCRVRFCGEGQVDVSVAHRTVRRSGDNRGA